MRWIGVAALLLLAGAMPAPAQTSDPYCRFYFGEEAYTPPDILEMLSRVDGSAVRMCPVSADYLLLSQPSRGPFHVCQVTQWRLVKEQGSLEFMQSESSGSEGRSLLMMISEGDCPRQDDLRYMPTEDVTAGVFVAAVHFWEELSSSEDGLDDLLASFRGRDISKDFARDLEDFERDFRKGEVRLSAVRLGGNDKRTAPYFALDLGRSGTFWSLLVDFEDDELEVLGLGMTIVD